MSAQGLNKASEDESSRRPRGRSHILSIAGEGHQSSKRSLGSLSPSALMAYPRQDALIFSDIIIDSKAAASGEL